MLLENYSGDMVYFKTVWSTKYGRGYGINKWKKLYELYVSKKIDVWSGNQPEEAHITDFQNIVPK